MSESEVSILESEDSASAWAGRVILVSTFAQRPAAMIARSILFAIGPLHLMKTGGYDGCQ
jgi:hypothetical protein